MKVKYIDIDEIIFDYSVYSIELFDSVKRIGLSFNVKTKLIDGKYYCIDGNKRLSIIKDLKSQGIVVKFGMNVTNNGDQRSNDCSRGRNTH